jgi:hypothetical protein
MTTSFTAHAESAWYFAAFPLYSFLVPEDTLLYLDIDDSQKRGKGSEKDVKKKKIFKME